MQKEYEIYVDNVAELPLDRETELEIRSLSPGKYKYEIKRVKAVLSASPKASQGDLLKLRLSLGEATSKVLGIKIVKELS
ncbi:MAG: phenylphosphate carboxylase subunit gamma [Dehalococcoidia bacterium]|nr:phenylphosphate carboxylase subunit gamma [Dehalococcoidia bacterium]MDZ4245728.1 phenylphosphate carboxylase subunit gamma [Dehalococcoidia bacterium]